MDREEWPQLLLMMTPSLIILSLTFFLIMLPGDEPAREPVGIHGYQLPQDGLAGAPIDDPAARLGFLHDLMERPL